MFREAAAGRTLVLRRGPCSGARLGTRAARALSGAAPANRLARRCRNCGIQARSWDGRYRLIEVNGRCYLSHGLATRCDINYPLLSWQDQSLNKRIGASANGWRGTSAALARRSPSYRSRRTAAGPPIGQTSLVSISVPDRIEDQRRGRLPIRFLFWPSGAIRRAAPRKRYAMGSSWGSDGGCDHAHRSTTACRPGLESMTLFRAVWVLETIWKLPHLPHPLTPYSELIVNFCPTGMIPTKTMTPHVPISATEVIDDACRALELGVAIIHLHARDKSGRPTWKAAIYEEMILGIRQHNADAIICVSCSGRDFPEFERRSEALELR